MCSCNLHWGNYPRSLRGAPALDRPRLLHKRLSFCCSNRSCRKRVTPNSVRFFGRRVYFAPFFLLCIAMVQGLKPRRVAKLCRIFSVNRRTLERWRRFWIEEFSTSGFCRDIRRGFPTMTGSQHKMPRSLFLVYSSLSLRERTVKVLKILAPYRIRPSP